MCMVMRGVQKVGSTTSTTTFLGTFESDSKIREEFFLLVNRESR